MIKQEKKQKPQLVFSLRINFTDSSFKRDIEAIYELAKEGKYKVIKNGKFSGKLINDNWYIPYTLKKSND
jgi:hypothetical protein